MIEISNLTNFSVDKNYFLGVAKTVLKGENRETENISIAFVGEKEIQKLNREYRTINRPTDVLSFEKAAGFKEDILEIVICPSIVKKKSESRGKLQKELTKTLIHGILHCLGYDHEISALEEEKMFSKEALYFSKV